VATPVTTDTLTTSRSFLVSWRPWRTSPPLLLDLGPVVGANISFFGERLACKIFVDDLFADIEGHARKGTRDQLAPDLLARLGHEPNTIDGILCWDLFDFLDRPTGQALATKLKELLRPGGAVYGLFGTTPIDLTHYTRFMVEAEDTLRLRPYPATTTRRNVMLTRDGVKLSMGSRWLNPCCSRRARGKRSFESRDQVRSSNFKLAVCGTVGLSPDCEKLMPAPRARVLPMRPIIAMLSDFGTRDHYAGVMKGVVLGICPDVALVDVSHELPAHDIPWPRASWRRPTGSFPRRRSSSS
jgi:hypothetical protein